jgi:hypothetical protein
MDSKESTHPYSDSWVLNAYGKPVCPFSVSVPVLADRLQYIHDFQEQTSVTYKQHHNTIITPMGVVNDLVTFFGVPAHSYHRYNPPRPAESRVPVPDQRDGSRHDRQEPKEEPSADQDNRDSPDDRVSVEQPIPARADPPRADTPRPDDIFQRVPILNVNMLGFYGMITSSLRPSDSPFYSSTGAPIVINHTLRRKARVIANLDENTVFLLNKTLWPLLHGLFIMRPLRKLAPPFSAAHALQILTILLHNRTITEKSAITKSLGAFYVRAVLSCPDLLELMDEFSSLSVLHNILDAEPPYQECITLLGHILDGLRRASSQLPLAVQGGFMEQVRELSTLFTSRDHVHPTAILLRLGPILQIGKSSESSTPDSAFSAMLTDHMQMIRSADSSLFVDDGVTQS